MCNYIDNCHATCHFAECRYAVYQYMRHDTQHNQNKGLNCQTAEFLQSGCSTRAGSE